MDGKQTAISRNGVSIGLLVNLESRYINGIPQKYNWIDMDEFRPVDSSNLRKSLALKRIYYWSRK